MPTFTQLTPVDRAEMLARIGVERVEDLFHDVPPDVRYPELGLPPALTELEAGRVLRGLASENVTVDDWPCFLGAGAYNHYIPSVVAHVMAQPGFATSYTPYQPEISQGTLQASFTFQSLVCDLLEMDAANASVYDGASAAAEAVLMAQRLTGRDRVVLSGSVDPQWRAVVATYLQGRDVEIVTSAVRRDADGGGRLVEEDALALVDDRTACLVLQQPDFFGHVRDLAGAAESVHARGALLVLGTSDPSSLGLLKAPGAWGADIAVAEGQALGLPLQFGGPWAGLMACRSRFVRQLPGRIVGQTQDADGQRGFVLTLQAREQHIRREKATSNICTSQTLLSIGIAAYLALMGADGLREVARQSHAKAAYAADRLGALPGFRLLTPRPFYHEFLLECPRPAAEVQAALSSRQILGGVPVGDAYPELAHGLLLAFTEQNTRAEIDALAAALREVAE